MSIQCVPLGQVADLRAGVGFPIDLQGRTTGKYPLAKVGDISRSGRSGASVLNATDHYVEEADLGRLKAKPIPEGSVLFAKIGEAIRQNHRAIAGRAMLIDNNAMSAVPGPAIESRYLYHFLRTVDLYRMATSTTVPALRKSELELIPVPLPSLEEQRRVGGILDQADALRTRRRLVLAECDELTASIFLDMFGDLDVNPHTWTLKSLDAVTAETKLGLVRGSQEIDDDRRYGYIRMNAISPSGELDLTKQAKIDATVEEVESYRLKPGDLLFNTRNSRSLVGKTALFQDDGVWLFNNNIMRIRVLPIVRPEFIAALFQTRFVKRQLAAHTSGTTSVFAIYWKDLRKVLVPVPPLKLQEQFVRKVAEVRRVAQLHVTSRHACDQLFGALQFRAFGGEL